MRLKIFCVLICLIFFKQTGVYGQQPIVIDSISKLHIGKNLSYYVSNKEMNLKEVLKEAEFIPFKKDVPNLGIHSTSVWIKFIVQNKSWSDVLSLELNNPTLDAAELFFQKSGDTAFDHILINKELPLDSRRYKGADFIIRMDRYAPTQIYYLRLKSNQPFILPININFPSTQLIHSITKNWLNGIYFGMILIMAFYNFFIFLSVKDRSYLYYVIFILSSGFTQLTLQGIGYQYFWSNSPFIESHSMVFFACISGISALFFTRKFLAIYPAFPKLDKFILLLIIPFILSLIFLSLGKLNLAFLLMRSDTALSSLGILFAVIYVIKKGKEVSAKYFLVAWIFIIFGSLVYILNNYGILPYNNFTNYSVQICSAIEMTLLSFALANRINVLKKEKELSRLSELRLTRENERIVKQQNVLLERSVEERTAELNHTLEGLKKAQTKLVAAEKMSSLGQLTAGVAHEINNPINFVAANVKPLKRDVFQLFDIITEVEGIYGQEDISLEEKRRKFALYKEEMDLDFLKIEIAQLLKGIKEGASRTADIVKGLRAFSRHDDDEFKRADINAGLLSTLTISNNLLKEIKIQTDLGDIPFVECHPGRLNQVFLNMLTNAIFAIQEKFGTNEGGEIEIKTYQEDGFVFISIKDNGIGMDEKTKLKLFEPFFTTKPVGEGTGLGMSIAFTFIEQHQGNLIVNSERGVGTEFVLRLFITLPKMEIS